MIKHNFFENLKKACNYNQKCLKAISEEIHDTDKVLKLKLKEDYLYLHLKRKGSIKEIGSLSETYEDIITIKILEDELEYKKITTATKLAEPFSRFTKTFIIKVSDEFHKEFSKPIKYYYYNEHSNLTYLPTEKSKPADNVIDITRTEYWDEDQIVDASNKYVYKTNDPNNERCPEEYDIIEQTITSVPYEDPNHNRYVKVLSDNTSFYNGRKYTNHYDDWFENLDKSNKDFVYDCTKPLDKTIKNGIAYNYILK